MENVATILFNVESEAYQALSELRREPVTADYAISQAAVIAKESGRIVVKDSFDTGINTADDAGVGGLVGALVGILGGPLGVLFGGSMGLLVGGAVDAGDAVSEASVIERVADTLADQEIAVIALVQEADTKALDGKLAKFSPQIIREDASVVMAEVEHAAQVQAELEKEARRKLRAEKKENVKKEAAAKMDKLKESFAALKAKAQK